MSRSAEAKDCAEDELTRLALAELTKEAERGKQRSSTMGVTGWMKPKMQPNKRFLKNTLLSAAKQRDVKSTANRTKEEESEKKSYSNRHKRPSNSRSEEDDDRRKAKKSAHQEHTDFVKERKKIQKSALPKR